MAVTGATRPGPVVVVGAGISGIACARELVTSGLPVLVYDRGHRLGGRMAVRTLDDRPVDVGASYFTVGGDDPAYTAVVADWERRGLARPWTDRFHVATPRGVQDTIRGPMRWAAPGGLRSLVEDLAQGLVVEGAVDVADVSEGPAVDGTPARAVVLAMPGPQARDLLPDTLREETDAAESVDWEPTLTLLAAWDGRYWPPVDGVFVNDSAVLTWIADDGRRRGDGAPVLVAHSTAQLAAAHLDNPPCATSTMLAEMMQVLCIGRPPSWATVKRWSLARPVKPRPEPYHLGDALIGLCGDGWAAPAKVESAFRSGHALGAELARRLS